MLLHSLGSQGAHGIDGGGATSGYDCCKGRRYGEDSYGQGKNWGVVTFHAIQLIGDGVTGRDYNGDADAKAQDDRSHGAPQNHAEDLLAIRADGHTQANLTGSTCDGVGGD